MKIFLSVAHSVLKDGRITSVEGFVNEYRYCRKLSYMLQQFLIQKGQEVTLVICPEYMFHSETQEQEYFYAAFSQDAYDLAVELHLNAFLSNMANGCETYYQTMRGREYAVSVTNKLGMRFKNRGVRELEQFWQTDKPAILIACFFCTNLEDCTRGEDVCAVANLIAEGIHAVRE